MNLARDMEIAIDLGEKIANLHEGKEQNIETARAVLPELKDPNAVDYLKAVIDEYKPIRIAG